MKLKMNAKPLGQSYTTAKPQSSINGNESSDKNANARTICEVTERVADIILQFFGSRDGQYYNDGKAQPKRAHDKLSSTTLEGKGLTRHSGRRINSVVEPISSSLGSTKPRDSAPQLRTHHYQIKL
jgi:hypothetical protein